MTRCYRRPGNEDGLYDFTTLGKPGFLGLFSRDSDGVSILRASEVGGGSLVYSNVTIRPPDSVLEDRRRHQRGYVDERAAASRSRRHRAGS